MPPPWDSWVWDANRNEVHDSIDALVAEPEPENVVVAVDYSHAVTNTDVEELLDAAAPSWYYVVWSAPIVLLNVSSEKLAAISGLQGVIAIDFLPQVLPELDVSTRAIKDRPSSTYSPNSAEEAYGVSGQGVLVGIIDEGIDDHHEALSGKVLTGAIFSAAGDVPCVNPQDGSGITKHGTGVAGIAVGRGGPLGSGRDDWKGVATNATLMDLRVVSPSIEGAGDIRAFDWAIKWNNRQIALDCGVTWQPIRVINISRGPIVDDCGQHTLSTMVRNAFAAGIVVVKSAGNGGTGANTLTGPTADGGLITVASVDDHNTVSRTNDEIAAYSSRGYRCSDQDADTLDELRPTVGAPGTLIWRPYSYNSETGGACSSCYYDSQGTSFAAPHVAGIVATMLELRSCLAPTSVDDTRVRDILITSTEYRTEADDVPPQHEATGYFGRTWNNAWGYGYVDAYEALTKANQVSC